MAYSQNYSVFHCANCGGQNKRSVGAKCQINNDQTGEAAIHTDTHKIGVIKGVHQDLINVLSSVSSRLTAIDKRIDSMQSNLASMSRGITSLAASNSNSTVSSEESDTEDDAILPSAKFLKRSKHMQEAVDQRLLELTALNKQVQISKGR